MLDLELASETVVLLPERALWWPRARTLVLADPHFGKDASFRAAGIPVPTGATGATLHRLHRLMREWPVRELIVLGDFFHSARSKNRSTLIALHQWYTERCQSEPEFRWHLVPGNHDRHAGLPPPELGIELHTDPWFCSPWAFRHAPEPVAAGFTLCGHLHPMVRLKKGKIDHLRLPCFWIQKQAAVLPAFGEFTGGYEIDLSAVSAEDQILLVADEKICRVAHK
jgi:DNA ligase-associated metallophosphoesterase